MKVIVTGANGQLGKDAVNLLKKSDEIYGFSKHEMDIQDLKQCRNIFQVIQPDVVIHCAAYTAVDLAENDEDTVYSINAYGSRNIAVVAQEVGAKIAYISTDYVFDGEKTSPYREFDTPNPQTIYGKSKWAGEQLIRAISTRFFIVRTSWVFGLHGNNFVKKILKLSNEMDQLKVVHDQIGSPTYTVDLCEFLLKLIQTEKYGIYHASNKGNCSWYEFAKAIFEECGILIKLEPCKTGEFPTRAPRPKYSVLENLAIRTNGFMELRDWRIALSDFLIEYRS